MKMAKTQIANLMLSMAAFGLFVANQINAFQGKHLDLRSEWGPYLLSGFLALGIAIQIGKIIEGHRHWLEVIVTGFLLTVHVVAEVTIWYRAQILGVGIPSQLPLWIVGLYWIVGLLDVLARFGARELQLFRGESEYERLQRQLREAKQEAALARQAADFMQKQVPNANAVQSHNAKVYEAVCPDCGQTLTAKSQRGVTNALNAHKRWCPAQQQIVQGNGSHPVPERHTNDN
jgi:hypothetical protein